MASNPIPKKLHSNPKVAPTHVKRQKGVAPGEVDKKAGGQNSEALKHARQSSQNLRGMGADPVASAAKAVRAHAGRFATSVAGFGGQVVKTSEQALAHLVNLAASSRSEAAKELQVMARNLLVPNKGSEVG